MARDLPSLNALRAFEAAARHESFTRAANELFVTHAAISRHVRLLEQWLGAELFVRHPQGVTLTEVGGRYLKRLTPIFDDLLAATREIRGDDASCALTVSVEVAFAFRWLVPRLGEIQSVCPDVELNIEPTNEVVNFRSNAAQIGIRFGTGEWEDVDVIRLADVEMFPVCSPTLADSHELGNDLKAVAGFTLIHESTRDMWQRWFQRAGVKDVAANKGPRVSSIHLALQAAEAGEGFALGDNVLTYDALAKGTLVRPFEKTVPIRRGYYLVRPSRGDVTDGAQSFFDWLTTELQAQEDTWQESKRH